MRKPLLLIAILALAWTTMDAAAVAHAARDTRTAIAKVICSAILAVLIWLWFGK